MLINIRQGIFESNSSSTHSMVIGMEDDFKKWEAGELLYYRSYNYPNGFYTKEEVITKLKSSPYYHRDFDNLDEDELMECLYDYGFVNYNQFYDNEYLETAYNTFTTPKGEKICIICEYGYDS